LVNQPELRTELDTVLIKVASRCNIDCSYCYVYHMGDDNWSRMDKLMSFETITAIEKSLGELAGKQSLPFSIVLHGGEPLLLGAERLRDFLVVLRRSLSPDYPISIQSNGILISNEILDICYEYQVSVAVSIDGPTSVHDRFRVNHKKGGTHAEVLQGIKTLSSHPQADFLYAGVLAVIDPTSDPAEVYAFFKELAPPSVDFLYRDGNHTVLPFGKASVASTEYGEWMLRLLDIYLKDQSPVRIRILDDLLKVLLGGIVSKEGIGVMDFGIIIIDTDGTITKNDTLKSSYNGADRFAKKLNVKDGHLIDFLGTDEFNTYRQSQIPTSQQCLTCPQLDLCGGGMILHRWKKENGYDNPSVYCSDQLLLMQGMRKRLAAMNIK